MGWIGGFFGGLFDWCDCEGSDADGTLEATSGTARMETMSVLNGQQTNWLNGRLGT
jgi:hypothetical protein